MSTRNVAVVARRCIVLSLVRARTPRRRRRARRSGHAGRRRGDRALGHQRPAERRRACRRAAARRAQGATVYEQKCARLPRRQRRGQAGRPRSPAAVGTLASRDAGAHRRQLLAVRDHALRLRAPRDADHQPALAHDDEVYAVTAYVLRSTASSARTCVMNAQTPAAGEDAEPRRLRVRLAAAGALRAISDY